MSLILVFILHFVKTKPWLLNLHPQYVLVGLEITLESNHSCVEQYLIAIVIHV